MSDKENPRFKIRFDEDASAVDDESSLQGAVDNLRIDKLRRKTNLMALLIPLLIGTVAVFGYLDLRNRYDKNLSTGSSEVQSLSKALESKFSSLSIRQAKLESLLPEKLAEIENATVALKIKLQQAETLLNNNLKASKSGNQALQERIEDVDKSIAPLQAEMKKLESQITSLEGRVSKELSTLSDGIDKTRKDVKDVLKQASQQASQQASAALEGRLDDRLEKKLDKKMFELAIRHQERLEQMTTRLSEQVQALQKKVSLLEEQQKASATRPGLRSEPASPDQPAAPPAPEKPAERKTPDGIVEKDLR